MPQFILKITSPADRPVQDPAVGCYIIDAALPEDFCARFVKEARDAGRLTLFDGDNALALCRKLGADGVLARVNDDSPYKKQLKPLREALSGGKILGAVCPPTRHAAMIVSEIEPDFVAFAWREEDKALPELLKWYNELFLIQSALEISGPLPPAESDFIIMPAKDFGC